jgi:peptidoglycan/xylan/chitin deacetylase (PgdA/CDA1 family)
VKGKREQLARLLGNRVAIGALKQVFRGPGIVCVTHHRVADHVEHDRDVISVTPKQLEQQAAWLHKEFLTLSGDEVADVLIGKRDLGEQAVSLTFDDGYEDNFAAGRMLMERFGIAATFFVPTGYIETGVLPPWDRIGYVLQKAQGTVLSIPAAHGAGPWQIDASNYDTAITEAMRLYRSLSPGVQPAFVEACEQAAGARASAGKSPFMSWSQIRQLRDIGHTIGAHTHTHPVLSSLTPAEQRTEIETSKRLLEARLGARARVFAYPYGKPGSTFSNTTKQIVRACGFDAAFSFYGGWNRPGRIDAYDVKRIKVDLTTSMPTFRTRVTTRGSVPV